MRRRARLAVCSVGWLVVVVEAVEEVHGLIVRRVHVRRSRSPQVAKHSRELAKLPPFMRRVAECLLEGMQRPEIAARIGRSLAFVSVTRGQITDTLGADSPLVAAFPRWHRGRPGNGKPATLEPTRVSLLTTPGPDGHVHVATFDDWGRGVTDVVAGHLHRVLELELAASSGHTHGLTDQRV